MPKVELGTCGVVAGEELKIENKNLPVGGLLFAYWACCGGLSQMSALIADIGCYRWCRLLLINDVG
jgi:hypothetical protein